MNCDVLGVGIRGMNPEPVAYSLCELGSYLTSWSLRLHSWRRAVILLLIIFWQTLSCLTRGSRSLVFGSTSADSSIKMASACTKQEFQEVQTGNKQLVEIYWSSGTVEVSVPTFSVLQRKELRDILELVPKEYTEIFLTVKGRLTLQIAKTVQTKTQKLAT